MPTVPSPTVPRTDEPPPVALARRAPTASGPAHRTRPRRLRADPLTPVGVALLAVAVLAAGCASSAVRPATSMPSTSGVASSGAPAYGSATTGSSAGDTVAARGATQAFTAELESATATFVAAVGRLQSDTAAGNTAAAEADDLAAQGAFDGFRVLEVGNPVNGSSIDELATDVGALESFGGLHAVERDLWTSGPLASDVAALAAQAPVAQFLLGREHLGPEAVGLVAVDQLNWVVDTALPVSQEQYAHRGLADVAATEQAAHRAFTDIEPLATLVDPTRTATVAGRFAALDAEVAALGDPVTTPDTSVDPAARLVLSRQLDATASSLAPLVAQLAPFGTRGAPS